MQHGVPAFRFLLPPGWVQRSATSAQSKADLERASEVFRRAGRPDLDAQFRALQRRTTEGIAKAKIFAIYRQEEVELDALLPMSITASALTPATGALDDVAADAFRNRGAELRSASASC